MRQFNMWIPDQHHHHFYQISTSNPLITNISFRIKHELPITVEIHLKLLIIRRKRRTHLESKLRTHSKGFWDRFRVLENQEFDLPLLSCPNPRESTPNSTGFWLTDSMLWLMLVLRIQPQFTEELAWLRTALHCCPNEPPTWCSCADFA